MRKVLITVIKRAFYPELADKYLSEGREAGPCPIHQEGERYVYEGGAEMPKGFCPWAWITIYPAVSNKFAGGFDNDWYKSGRISVECCTDGVRPVVYLIEAVDE